MAHPADEQLREYQGGRLSPQERLSLDDHLTACERCRGQVLDPERLRSAVAALKDDLAREAARPVRHASRQELAAYARAAVDPVTRELLTEHLEACDACAAGLRRLSARPPAGRRGLRRLGVAAAAALVAAAAAGTIRLRTELRELRSERDGLERKERALREQNEALRASADSLGSELRRLQAELAGGAARPRVMLADAGGPIGVDEQGRVQGPSPRPDVAEERVRAALWTRTLPVPVAVAALRGAPGQLRGGRTPAAFAPLSPVGTAVASDRPAFRWEPLPGAAEYVVRVFDARLREVASSAATSASAWTPAAALPRGETYSWQVTARRDGEELTAPAPPAPEARFRIVEASRLREVEAARRRLRSHLLLGIVYAEAGLLAEAQREIEALRALNPGSEVVRGLLDSLGLAGPAPASR